MLTQMQDNKSIEDKYFLDTLVTRFLYYFVIKFLKTKERYLI